MKSLDIIRRPAFAGQFYPQDRQTLEKTIDSFLNAASVLAEPGKLRMLIVPHAGIEFSGPVAAAGFKQLEGQNYSRVILLGPSHQAYFDSVAVFPQGSWETPLGKVEVDPLAKSLLAEKQKIVGNSLVHEQEHSLEVELIFLQRVLKDFKIVPILIGQVDEKVLEILAEKIAPVLDENTLLVVSSDLSHYPSYSLANQVDDQTVKAILSGSSQEFKNTLKEIEEKNYPYLDTCACGYNPILVALKVVETLKINRLKKIKYENSGDRPAGDKTRVVGYAAIGAWSKSLTNFEKEALAIARQALEAHLSRSPTPQSLKPQSAELFKKQGAFVTLKKHGQLRGCLGEFEPNKPLYQVIEEMAIAAATQDPRFPKVLREELKEIKIEISVMTPKRKINDWQEIELGKHGVVVQYGGKSGTFLPQVATETGWSKEEFLAQLCQQKAGLPSSCYKNPAVSLYVFEVQIIEEK